MLKIFCGICGNISERSLHNVFINCENCEMYSGWKVIDAEDSDLAEIDNILSEFRECLYRDYAQAGSSVFPVFRHEPSLTVETLDLLILFFDHITLQIDGFNIDENNYSQIINKYKSRI